MEGKKVRIRGLERTDLDEIMKWVNDPEVTITLDSFVYPMSKGEEEKWLEDRITKPDDKAKNFVIETKEGVYLGGIGLLNINWRHRHAEVGIVIGKKEHWNRGYGTDAMMVILDLAFNKMNLHRVYLRVHAGNLGGIKSYEKCGFKKEGVEREAAFVDGKYADVIFMGILEEEFRGRK
jgi:RimJ/RimL family protein N-acetyltransferase